MPIPESFDERVAERLCSRSTELTRLWLERLERRLRVRPAHIFPREELLDHMPLVLERLASLLRAPEGGLTQDAVEHLHTLARHRRRQGYDVQEVLAELEILGDILFDALRAEAAAAGSAVDPAAVVSTAARLQRGLAGAATITAGTYREEEVSERRERVRSTNEFARTLAHEIKNPLGAAEGAARLLEEEIGGDAEDRRRFAAIVLRNLMRARRLVDDVRTLAAAQRGEPAEQRCEPLSDVIQGVRGQVEPMAREADVRLRFPEEVPRVHVDAARVGLALVNLVANAVKYADPDKPERCVALTIEPRHDGGWVIEVADNGVGIPDEQQPHVFERFFRGRTKDAEGTGLGLAITLEAIEQIGGRIRVDSESGRGTAFQVELPPGRPRPEPAGESAVGAGVRPATGGSQAGAPPAPELPDAAARPVSNSPDAAIR